jgi:hypothetical protein
VAKTLGNYPELGRMANRRIGNSTLVPFAELGHAPQLQDPQAFEKACSNTSSGCHEGRGRNGCGRGDLADVPGRQDRAKGRSSRAAKPRLTRPPQADPPELGAARLLWQRRSDVPASYSVGVSTSA